ncbi:hypothetical protein BJV77DRAFT_1066896 [Russula vinacea]|nr:hypothetical protein BJV77DRAFT_1066896 [Russula vinacea]
MRLSILTSLFFALFALFSTLALAVPVAPQGAVGKRQCSMGECKDALPAATSATPATPSATPGSGSNVSPSTLLDIISGILNLYSSPGSG